MTSLADPSLDALYRAHSSWLVGWLSTRARCRTRASDLAQETFCRLAEHPGLSLQAHPRRYLATVARRLLIDDVRRRKSERSFLEAFALHMGHAAPPTPERIAEAVQELTILVQLLGELPERARRAFLLSRVDGLTYGEIAAELGVSVSRVKQYVARAFAHCYIVAHGCPD
ncbi:sigma-70 family RNA polymerase sigma factor [Iodidimonas sp. SYSU 1G8]|uniref:sigma-70 family RNA polymerase sigma factor n=1 Tax=Iodidimonas sp. SYSU 1G8 TaxID=3133967 RepID=UPI0031FF2BDF